LICRGIIVSYNNYFSSKIKNTNVVTALLREKIYLEERREKRDVRDERRETRDVREEKRDERRERRET